ncbi:MAG: class I SAM-dependent methyltransferase [Anaerolineaceae bacterium]
MFVRPEPEAVWKPALSENEWNQAHAFFQPAPEENGGHWQFKKQVKERWSMGYRNLKFWVQPTNSRHLGVFPEQACQWDWITEQITGAGRPLRVLNLFGYTGLASLAAARAGAEVTHVDASRKVVTWAHENLTLSGLDDQPVHWIVDDALKFVERQGRRGGIFDGLILDPPKFGRGPKGEVWEFYKLLPNLLSACRTAMSSQPKFIVLTAYAVKASSLTLHQALQDVMAKYRGKVESGEVVLSEKSNGRLISMAVFSRWSAE